MTLKNKPAIFALQINGKWFHRKLCNSGQRPTRGIGSILKLLISKNIFVLKLSETKNAICVRSLRQGIQGHSQQQVAEVLTVEELMRGCVGQAKVKAW